MPWSHGSSSGGSVGAAHQGAASGGGSGAPLVGGGDGSDSGAGPAVEDIGFRLQLLSKEVKHNKQLKRYEYVLSVLVSVPNRCGCACVCVRVSVVARAHASVRTPGPPYRFLFPRARAHTSSLPEPPTHIDG